MLRYTYTYRACAVALHVEFYIRHNTRRSTIRLVLSISKIMGSRCSPKVSPVKSPTTKENALIFMRRVFDVFEFLAWTRSKAHRSGQ